MLIVKKIKFISGLFMVLGVTACTSLSAEKTFQHVSDNVYEKTKQKISWQRGSLEDYAAKKSIKRMLSRQLTARTAVQIALLNNKSLQATYMDLGIAQADLVQAGLLSNPVIDGAITFPQGVNTPNLAFGAAMKFIELLWIPLRKEIAKAKREQVKIRVTGQVLDHAMKTHSAFIDYIAARQQVELLRQVVSSTLATMKAAKALREAGNITAFQFDQQQSVLTQAKLDLANAETQQASARETLNQLMGLTGRHTNWRAPKRLPKLPARELSTARIEERAIKNSLELAEMRQALRTLASQYRITNIKSILPDIELGAEYERDDGEKQRGPIFEVEVPIFDIGEAKRAKAKLEVKKLQNQYWAMAVRIRSSARLLRAQLLTARKTSLYYKNTILPESTRLLTGMQRDYNAMQASVFQLITAKRQQILAGQKFIIAQQAYWRARISFQHLLNGRMPDGSAMQAMNIAAASSGAEEAGGH